MICPAKNKHKFPKHSYVTYHFSWNLSLTCGFCLILPYARQVLKSPSLWYFPNSSAQVDPRSNTMEIEIESGSVYSTFGFVSRAVMEKERKKNAIYRMGKESVCNAGDTGSISGSRRSPGEENGNRLQYSCLENPMGRGAWQITVHGVAKSWTNWATQTKCAQIVK